MLVKDEALQGRHAAQGAHAAYADRVNAATLAELGCARVMADGDLAPHNPARQLGRVLSVAEFELLVAKLGVPNLLMEPHPAGPSKRCMYQIRDGAKHLICVYEGGPMPEYSIMTAVVKWIPDMDYLGEGARTVSRADLTDGAEPVTNTQAFDLIERHGFEGAAEELQKRAAEPSHLGMRRVLRPGPEAVRGWRTVLVYMMQHGLVSPEQIRTVAGGGGADRASWKGYLDGDREALGAWLQ